MTIDQVVDLYDEELENWQFLAIDNMRMLMNLTILLYVCVIIIGI